MWLAGHGGEMMGGEVRGGGKEDMNFWRIGISSGINGKEGRLRSCSVIGGCNARVLE